MSFVPCMTWIKRGSAKREPEKLQLSKEDLETVINHTRLKIRKAEQTDDGNDSDDCSEDEVEHREDVHGEQEALEGGAECPSTESTEDNMRADDSDGIVEQYGLDVYDDDEDTPLWDGIGGITYYASNAEDPYITNKTEDDSDDGNFLIEDTDNLLVLGRVQKDCSVLEVHVYNESDNHSYVHHDVILPAFPLTTEWLNYDPSEDKSGNLLAIGSLEPTIDIWDLDVVNSIEPDYVLGTKKQKKPKKGNRKHQVGHTEAVLDLSWNTNVRNVLASGSADYTIALWDLNQGVPVTTLKRHKEKVQTLQWHPFEAQSLLSGSFDNTVNVYDCRDPDHSCKTWNLNGEVERVIWNHFSPMCFLTSTDKGFVYSVDARMDKPVFTLSAHDKAVTGLSLSSQIPNCLVTASSDTKLKVWDIDHDKPQCVLDKQLALGELQCLACCPEAPFVFAVGGETDFRIIDIRDSAAVRGHFTSQAFCQKVTSSKDTADSMEVEDAVEPTAVDGDITSEASKHVDKVVVTKPKKKQKKKKTKK